MTDTSLCLDLGAATDVGRVRTSNEDSLVVIPPSRPGAPALVAVADGMGGHNAGEVASAIAIQTLAEVFEQAALSGRLQDFLRAGVERANARIWHESQLDASKDGMGTTLVCGLVSASGEVVLANVGDSRAYVASPRGSILVTMDHSWVAEQVQAGRMTEADAERSPYRHVLTRSLGVTPGVEVDLFTEVRLGPDEALVLCSDGVTAYVTPDDLTELLGESSRADELAQRMVGMAVSRGGADNATVAVAWLRPRP